MSINIKYFSQKEKPLPTKFCDILAYIQDPRNEKYHLFCTVKIDKYGMSTFGITIKSKHIILWAEYPKNL